jgi:hypothetical protein
MRVKNLFSKNKEKSRPLDLVAFIVFQKQHFKHYTAFVRVEGVPDKWRYHDGPTVKSVGEFALVVEKCGADQMVPCILFYDFFDAGGGGKRVDVSDKTKSCNK